MVIELISFLIFVSLVVLVAIPLSATLVSIRARITGRYLNRYYIVSRKKDGSYELHHQPAFGYYFARERKFHRFTVDAIQRFRDGYPDQMLFATTLSLQSNTRNGTFVDSNGLLLTGARLMADLLIVCNLAAYRKVSGRWLVVLRIREVHRTIPMRYILVNG